MAYVYRMYVYRMTFTVYNGEGDGSPAINMRRGKCTGNDEIGKGKRPRIKPNV